MKYGSRKAMIVSRNELDRRAMGRSGVQLCICSSVGCGQCQEHNMNLDGAAFVFSSIGKTVVTILKIAGVMSWRTSSDVRSRGSHVGFG